MSCLRFLPCHKTGHFVFEQDGRLSVPRGRCRARLGFRGITDLCPVCLPTYRLLQRRRFVNVFFDDISSVVVLMRKPYAGAEVRYKPWGVGPRCSFPHPPTLLPTKTLCLYGKSVSFYSVLFPKSLPAIRVNIYASPQSPNSPYDPASPHWPYYDESLIRIYLRSVAPYPQSARTSW